MNNSNEKTGPILVGPGFRLTAVLALALGFGLSACVSMSSLQTARTLKPGEAQWTAGGGTYNSGDITDALSDTKGDELSIPFMEVSYRQGLTKDWDFGLKTTFASVNADAKYALIQGDKFAMATGAGLNYFSIESKVGVGTTETKFKTTVYDLMVPLMLSYDFSKSVSLYGGPKFISRFISGSGKNGNVNMAGGTGGLKIGETWGAYLEGSYYKTLGKNPFDGTQFNVAIFWDASPIF